MERSNNPKKKKVTSHVNHERWLVSYADFITLMFAFFVVMYSISNVNEGKYRALSSSLDSTFKGGATSNPIEIGQVARTLYVEDVKKPEGKSPVPEPLDSLTRDIKDNFKDLIEKKLLNVKTSQEWIQLEMKSSLLFGVADIQPAPEGLKVIDALANLMKTNQFPIQVEGFTDNLPISNEQFPSNWDLSVARAATIVRLLVQAGVSAERLMPVGYGENYPIADNKDEEGRSHNRRVVLVIQRSNDRLKFLKENQFQNMMPKITIPGYEKPR